MGLRKALARPEERALVWPPLVPGGSPYGGPAGIPVTEDSAMRHDAVWSCVTAICQDVSMLPVDVLRYLNGTRQDVNPVPQIIAAPSAMVDPMDWRYQLLQSWLTAGNAWGLVTQTSGNGAYPTRIELQRPQDVKVLDMGQGVPLRILVNNKPHDLWPVGDLWHKPAYTVPGQFLGLSPIAYHALSIGVGIAADQFGADFFSSGGHPSSILSPETNPGPEGAKALKEKFIEATQGREPMVMPQSIKYMPIQVNPTDSMFLDAMRYSVEQICRIYREDPADHGASGGGTAVTYANRSDADLARFKRRQFWVTKLQNCLTDLLPRPQIVKLNTSAALMMTDMERHTLHKLRLDSHTISVNEVRRIEDEVPYVGPKYDMPGLPPADPSDIEIAQLIRVELDADLSTVNEGRERLGRPPYSDPEFDKPGIPGGDPVPAPLPKVPK